MLGSGRARRFTATGDIATGGASVTIHGLVICPGTAITTVTLREGGSGGTIVLNAVCPANGTPFAIPTPFTIKDPHVTLTGAAGEITAFL